MSQVITFGGGGSGGSGVTSLAGNTGGALTGALHIVTANATVIFAGAGTTITQDFNGDVNENVVLGSSLPSQIAGCVNNTGCGFEVLNSLTSGSYNTAFGQQALTSLTTPQFNTALGQAALTNLISGNGHNVAVGNSSGGSLTSGAFNTFIGFEAGDGYDIGSESSNISIGTSGVGYEIAGNSNTLVIGKGTGTGNYELAAAFICGIDGVDVGSVAKVVTMASDQLGTATLTAGSGVTITPGANTITISASGGGGGVSTLTGDAGGAISPDISGNINVTTTNATNIKFVGSGNTLALQIRNTGPTSGNAILSDASLVSMTSASNNTGFGTSVFAALTTGTSLVALGAAALNQVVSGTDNIAIGANALGALDTGTFNIAIGTGAGSTLNSGVGGQIGNTLIGHQAGAFFAGNYNVFLGYGAGNSATSSNSTIYINNVSASNEDHTLRIGDATGTGTQQLNKAFICGIRGIVVTGVAVLVSSSDQLGVAASSRRFKNDIKDMGSDADFIYKLRPVTFTWNRNSNPGLKDATTDKQYGLIAEEVVQVNESLVNRDENGLPLNVNYDRLIPMLLNEIQRLEKRISSLESKACNHG